VVSPVLSNIYLDRLDKFAETVLIPEHTRGTGRKANPARMKMANAMTAARKRADRAAVRELRIRARGMPARDPVDPGYRRLRYIRYADDHLLGFTGPKAEAEQIRQKLAAFLRDELKLELSADKTLITHARTQKARFLGYDIIVQHSLSRPRVNGHIGLRVPKDVITAKQAPYRRHGTPWYRPGLLNLDDLQIISTYGAEYRGIVQYYLLAQNVFTLHRLRRAAETSMLKTLSPVPGVYLPGLTNVPRPCRVMMTPRSRKISIARRTVVYATPYSSASARSAGSFSVISPLSIRR
jgi:Reverse transcriptase (RNA-dependent DNA polymerase)/Type II intron maturase